MRLHTSLVILAAMAVGCVGSIGDTDRPSAAAEPDTGGAASSVGRMPMRRLNAAEYAWTFRDLFGIELSSGHPFVVDVTGASGFPEGAGFGPSTVDQVYEDVASIARNVIERSPPVCAGDQRDCARVFVETTGRRVYRHRLGDAERDDLLTLYDDARRDLALDHGNAIRVVLTAMLSSPRFHYHWELGDRPPTVVGDRIALTGAEIASRLSYFLWRSTPDDRLLELEERLTDPEVIRSEVDRMLADPKAKRGVREFVRAWLDLGQVERRAVAETGERRALLLDVLEATDAFVVEHFFGAGDRSFHSLMTADWAFVNERTAPLYGLQAIGPELRRVDVDRRTRAGLFTQPAFLAATASSPLATPIRRGRFLQERLATCRVVPPPSGTIPEPPERHEGASVREQLSEHATNGVCQACHRYMDPIGFAFGGYDATGADRDLDDYGRPLDRRGSLELARDRTISFDGAPDLLRQLAKADETERCVAEQVLRFGLGKPLEAADRGSIDAAAARFGAADGDLLVLLKAVTEVVAFTHRAPNPGEILR
jgi:hypothetical protein